MSRLDSSVFYSRLDEAPQQGDILLGAVSRIVAGDGYCPPRWRALDEHTALLAPAQQTGHVTMPELRVSAGRALVMVVTHECGLDKEFNVVVDQLIDTTAGSPVDEVAAIRMAEDRDDLDRAFTVSPLIDPTSVSVAGAVADQGLLMSGRIVGYLPVPELRMDSRSIIPASVVDLSYRTTLDRLAYTRRLTCVSEAARQQLRFALAKLDVLRTPSLEVQLSEAVGQTITSAKVSKSNPLVVQLQLADGSTLELLKQPGGPAVGPVARTRRSVRGDASK